MTERPLRKEPSKAFNRKKEEPKVVKIRLELALCITVVFLIGKAIDPRSKHVPTRALQ